MNLLTIRNLRVKLGGKPVLHGVDCKIEAGEFVGLIGPNGAGKSTLLRAALRLVPAEGIVTVAGRESMPERERARHIAYLPQEREIAWAMSVRALVGLGREPHRSPFSPPGQNDITAVESAMRRMHVDAIADRPATSLSGGEKARVLIARALAQDAPLLLADEPAAGLDPSSQIALMRIFAELAREGHGVVASMHDLGLAARWCQRLVLIDKGRIIADGAPRDVLTAELISEVYGITAYLGEAEGGLILLPLDLARQK